MWGVRQQTIAPLPIDQHAPMKEIILFGAVGGEVQTNTLAGERIPEQIHSKTL